MSLIKNKTQKKPIFASSISLKTHEKLEKHLEKIGMRKNFFIEKAIAEKLKRDSNDSV